MTKIEINEDLQGGRVFGGEICDGDTVTVYGVRYEIGLDGQGATLRKVEIDKYPHHHDIGEIGVTHDLPVLQMTAAEYDRLAGGCLADEVGGDTTVSIHPDNTYTVGEYDGNQYGESLI